MMVTSETISKFLAFVNGTGRSGYCKPWKAFSILDVWNESVYKRDISIQNKFIRNSLEMEGFSPSHCDEIADWLRKEFK